jgi:hypothetical protein
MAAEDIITYNGVQMRRDYAESLERAQRKTHYTLNESRYPRIPYGQETFRNPAEAQRQPCRHCSTVFGKLHEPLCDYEQCPVCGGQVMSCDCGIFTEHAIEA